MEFLQPVNENESIIILVQFHLFIKERGLKTVVKSINFHKQLRWLRIFTLLFDESALFKQIPYKMGTL